MEASYCYMVTEAKQNADTINETTSLDTTENGSETLSRDSNSTSSTRSSSSSGKAEDENHEEKTDMSINITTDIHDLKKNLCNEEEFRSINHSEPIHIFLKLKPLSEQEIVKQNNIKNFKIHSDTAISLIPPKNSVYSQNKQAMQNLSNTLYSFSYVFQPDITQQDFFKATIYPCLEKFFSGDNLLIFSYGVTCSGKTFTMQGTNQNPGLIPRTLDVLFETIKNNLETKRRVYGFKPEKFNEITSLSDAEFNTELALKEQILKLSTYKELDRVESFNSLKDLEDQCGSLMSSKKFGSLDSLSSYPSMGNLAPLGSDIKIPENKKFGIWLCFYELYNDNVYDLLTLPTKSRATLAGQERPPLKIREDMNRIPYVEGLNHIPVFNTKEAIKVLKYGEKNLQKSSNSINTTSSRSHAIFCLKLVTIENNTMNSGYTVCINQLSFCDLAGIERSSKTNAVGITQKEASSINTSLMSLSRCIETMMQNQKNSKSNQLQVPYRVNKLTRLFQAYFEGRGMVKMIVNLNPSVQFFDENVNVLKFASIANQIQIGLNDEDKIHYKIEPEKPVQNNRLTVAWETDQNKTKHVSDSEEEEEEETEEEESEEDDEEEEEEVDETEVEETVEESVEEEEEEDESLEEEEDEEEETEESEEEVEESVTKSKLQKTSSTIYEETVDEETEEESEEETVEESDDDEETEEEEDEEEDETVEEIEETEMTVETTTNETADQSKIKAESTRIKPKTPKSIMKSTSKKPASIEKSLHKTQVDLSTTLNDTTMSIVKNTVDMTKLQTMSNQELLSIIDGLKSHIIKTKREATKFEADLRNQLVTKWSKKVEDTEEYFQKEMQSFKERLDADLKERIEFMEQVNERKNKVRLDELKKENEVKMTEYESKITSLSEELDRLKEELSSKTTTTSGSNDRSIKRKLSESLYDDSNFENNDDINMMEFDDDVPCSVGKNSFRKPLQVNNQSMQIQTSFIACGINTSIQTETIKKKSIGIDADPEFVDQMYTYKKDLSMMNHEFESLNQEMDMKSTEIDNLRSELKNQIDLYRQLDSESKQIQNELRSQLKLSDVNIKSLQSQLSEKEDKLKQLSEQNAKLKDKINQLEEEAVENFKTLEDFNTKFTKVKSESDKEKKMLKDQCDEYRKELELVKIEMERVRHNGDQLRLELDEMKQTLEEKNVQIDALKNELQFKDNRIDRILYESEQQKEKEVLLEQYKVRVAKLEAENASVVSRLDSVSLPPPVKKFVKQESIDEEIPPEVETIKMKKSKSGTSLRKISKSGSKLSILSENGDEPEKVIKKVLKKKHSVDEASEQKEKKKDKDSSIKKSKKSVDAHEDESSHKKVKKSVDPIEDHADLVKKVKKSVEPIDDIADMDVDEEPKPVKVTKKKSTLNRITEMIAKSPILEPLRNRPTRHANLKASSSNASEISTCSTSSTTSKKVKTSSKNSNLIETLNKIEDDENLNPELEVEEEKPKKVLRKKRAV